MTTKDLQTIRDDFSMLEKKMQGNPLIYFDNAATTFKPASVIEAIKNCYENEYATVHRGVYELSNQSSANYFKARKSVQSFINALSEKEIIFTSGTTASINLVAQSFGEAFIGEGDEILITEIEHHSNLVPWQMLTQKKKAKLKFIPVLESGDIDVKRFKEMLTPQTKLVSFAHTSNVIGVIHPIKEMVKIIRENSSAKILVDGAQAISHQVVDVQNLDVDFYAFSAHKLLGPTGMGVLYGKRDLLEKMPPVIGGGDMIAHVTQEKTTYNELPFKFEAGTPNIAGVIGLEAAICYLHQVGFDFIQEHENALTKYALEELSKIPSVKIVGSPKNRASLISFTINSLHNLDVATLLNFKGVAIRSGHLCAQTALERFNISSMLRISFAFYNTFEEIDRFIVFLKEVIKKLS